MEWNFLTPDPAQAEDLSRQLDLPLLIARLLINRGVQGVNKAQEFFSPSLADLPHPGLMKDMEKAVSRITQAIRNKERMAVFGDYDADGITATALLLHFLKPFSPDVTFYLPHRTKEGYGLSQSGISGLKEQGVGLIITVDCGISNQAEIDLARELGIEVIVTDHHQIPRRGIPSALAVINPNQEGCLFPYKEMAGVGVAFYLAIALRQAFEAQGLFLNGRPNLKSYMDLVALGTVADMVPLTGVNRILVRDGLEVMTRFPRLGLAALKEISGLKPRDPVSSYDVSFRLAPRLNALGRMREAREGVMLLTTQNPEEARQLAQVMNQENTNRQATEKSMLKEIEALFQHRPEMAYKKSLVFASEAWPRGILGLVASKLVEFWSRPAFVFSIEGDLAQGSGRSIEGFHLVKGLEKLENLLVKFGGHAAAAGVTLRAADLPDFEKGLEELVEASLPATAFIPSLTVEGEVDFSSLVKEILPFLNQMAPFGMGNPDPVLVARGVTIREIRQVGNGHLSLRLEQRGVQMKAFAFGLGDHPIQVGESINLAFSPNAVGKDLSFVQLKIRDIEPKW
jgi:single-stranded-DNA-specific exonuclease